MRAIRSAGSAVASSVTSVSAPTTASRLGVSSTRLRRRALAQEHAKLPRLPQGPEHSGRRGAHARADHMRHRLAHARAQRDPQPDLSRPLHNQVCPQAQTVPLRYGGGAGPAIVPSRATSMRCVASVFAIRSFML